MTDNLPEFDVSVKMTRKTGPDQTEYRTFTARVPAVDQQHAEAAAYGLGHGINDASRYAWKFVDTDPNVSAEPAIDTGAKVDELTAELASVREQLTAANRHADGLEADLRSANTANTNYAGQVKQLKRAIREALNGVSHVWDAQRVDWVPVAEYAAKKPAEATR